ncbi:homocysteine S-methyltransferase family protein [Actinomadura sp. WMMB 499]|uniref:homocysteine S-methyltransferase family protein n=1 Tax=Actinomadura sp. WMMB 499 TaxID=1219491 RepID=UPI0012476B0F|nr:homocysteine S-methyltransferase family protein [Actinomadura sp. WMMB 499]QFG22951.1 homocysteine S-methyltransferase family protein [Actinomadura sp. WMMB 499]
MTDGTITWLDGGVATELQRGGLSLRAPWWTTLALNSEARREDLRRIHERYLAAGADLITANTFRCNRRALDRIGLDGAGLAWMVHAAVGVARAACGTGRARVAGSMAPVEDCYRPDLVPPDAELRDEHRWLATELMRAGVDLVLVETMNTAREARIALEQVQAAGGRAWVSFVCGDAGRLPSGEGVAAAAAAVERDGAEAVLVNCGAPADAERALAELRDACSGPIGACPGIEDRGPEDRWTHVDRHVPAALSPDGFADLLRGWRDKFAPEILGGCCGTTPDHLAAATGATP